MYSKKYRITKVESNKHNPLHEQVKDTICHPAYLNVGERGWILYRPNDVAGFDIANRLHTSIINNITYEENQIIVETENTKYVLELIEE